MILFCLPYAGGSETIYYTWKKYLKSSIQLRAVELKGRGKRYDENFYETLEEAVDDIFESIKDKLNEDYAIYGHSMGSLLAYELYYKIDSENLRKPEHIFFSGYKAPSVIRGRKNIHMLPDGEFIKEVINLGGTPEEVATNEELLKFFIPILRSDFKILENYIYHEKKYKIQCDVSILNGNEDLINLEDILSWKKHIDKKCNIYNFEGNHFFINKNRIKIIKLINQTLTEFERKYTLVK